ncbi:MAG TPA: ABC transporter substrate-binding protein [Vineibacter sp.]|nr:ABC transporter substrate-binding protein [Vineibacter sp.]
MRRRDLLLGLGGAAALRPIGAAAQDKRRPRLAFFVPVFPEGEISETGGNPSYRAIFEELRRHGYEEGQTIAVERWSARGDPARYPELAREIVRTQPDLIYTVITSQAKALLVHTTTIPIIVQNVDLVDAGLAASFSRPGRNVTGYSPAFSGIQLLMKRLQLLREAVPTVSRIAVLMPNAAWDSDSVREFREAASGTGATIVAALLRDPVEPEEYRRVFAAMPDQRIDAVWVPEFLPDIFVHRHLIIDLATGGRLPAVTGWRDATERGGLMSYGADRTAMGRMMADLIVRVLRGEKPADMPLRSVDKFELVINLKTARALGLTIPPTLLVRADEVIE